MITTALTKKHIYTVSELTGAIRATLEDSFSSVWVEGEISNFTLHSSGHMYFSLKDEGAVISCVIFRGSGENLKFLPKDGLKVIASGRISVYDKQGRYQLYVEVLEPKGLGALQLAFNQLKEKLLKEGLFDSSHKKPIPYLPSRIGVVTSPTGAAIRDILNVARRRFQNIEIIINPVKVQGEGAKEEIAEAIDDFNKFNNAISKDSRVEVLIVGRGGGSAEDLWAFNEEIVARAIYASEIPVISAVGHEIDWTIADFVADLRAATPSAAAEIVIPEKTELKDELGSIIGSLRSGLLNKINILSERLKSLRESYAIKEPMNIITQNEQFIDENLDGLYSNMDSIIRANENKFINFAGKLEILSPLAVLARGYSVTYSGSEDKILKDAGSIKKGDNIKTILHKGEILSKVEEIINARD